MKASAPSTEQTWLRKRPGLGRKEPSDSRFSLPLTTPTVQSPPATIQPPISTIRWKTLNNFSKVCYSLPCILSLILARQLVPLTPANTPHSKPFLSRPHFSTISPLDATLIDHPASVAGCPTLGGWRVGLGFPFSLHPTSPQRHSIRPATVQPPFSTIRCKTLNNFSKVCYSLPCTLSPILARSPRRRFVPRSLPRIATFGRADVPIPLPPILRTLFQVPYPLSPVFATLARTPGVYGYSSHSGTSSLPSHRSPTPFPASLPHCLIPSSSLSPLAATLIDPPASVANKRLTA